VFGVRLIRKSTWRTVVVCATLPLTVFNGRTVVGCGCTGHFEAVCHCSCHVPNCGDHHGTSCPCCDKHHKAEATSPAAPTDASHKCAGNDAHRCKSIAQHEVTPATLNLAHSADEETQSIFTLDSALLSYAADIRRTGSFLSEHSVIPHVDRVVALRRLVI